MASVFDGQRAIWMWEFGRQAEQDIAAVAETARTLAGADLVLLKAMDGLDWMATYDQSPAAPAGPAAWRQLTEQGAAAAISVLGILLTAVAAVQAANPMPQIALTLAAVAVLIVTVVRSERS